MFCAFLAFAGQLVFFVLAVSAVEKPLSTKLPAPSNCKKLPVDSDWPSEETWNRELPGNQKRGAQKKWTSPDYTYVANTVQRVQAAVKFAAAHRVRLSILNSGHDFIGRNDAPSGIRLIVTGLKGIRVLESFSATGKGAEGVVSSTKANVIKPVPGKQAAATIGGGVNIDELNKELRKSGLYAIGAAHGSVSVAGGWAQAGGHAPLSSYYGLGADQVLEYKVVVADGRLVVANAASNPDLFWALRGGGPSTFGIVVEATIKVYPSPTLLSYGFYLNTSIYDDRKSIWAPAAYLCSQLPRLNREHGFQGYFTFYKNALSANWLIPNEFANATKIKEAFDPVIAKMVEMPGIDKKTVVNNPPREINQQALGGLQGSGGGVPPISGPAMKGMKGMDHGVLDKRHGPGEMAPTLRGLVDMDSRLLGEAELTHEKLAEALEKAIPNLPNGQLRSHLTAGGKVLKLGEDTSVLPAWRKAYVHLIASTSEGTPNIQSLRDISPQMGAYVNEAWYKNPNWKHDFWGVHYPKLSAIKDKWDPSMVFYATPGINADRMIAKDGRLCRNPGESHSDSDRAPDGDNQNHGDHDKPYPSFPILAKGKGVLR